ncbi:serine hydrolase domain-containing protein [Phytomonospora sp. NPDC050363]|uniref:serine hydrolase domain-containing protein n=1 Tax=Phytomonospora sp. NPDC050363 TaxID=3155642 RepID=UPI0033F6E6A6
MHTQRALLPRSTPTASGVSARAVNALLDRLEEQEIECHSLMVVRRGHVVAEGWWAPYTPDRPHLLYSLTKSFTAIAAGLAIADGLLSLDDRVVDVLPDRIPEEMSDQARRITVHHLLSMTAGHDTDSLTEAWELEPTDLVKGYLRVPFPHPEGTRHAYDNATTYVLARMVERATGQELPEFLDRRLLNPMGIHHAEWDRVASGASFGFHGLHLTTEAVAAFGEMLRREGMWEGRRLVPRDWVRLATGKRIDTFQVEGWSDNPDVLCGYGYQFWRSRHGYHGAGSFGQFCLVVPEDELVIVLTAAIAAGGETLLNPVWECLWPGVGVVGDGAQEDTALAERLRGLALPLVVGAGSGSGATSGSVEARADGSAEDSALTDGVAVKVEPVERADGGGSDGDGAAPVDAGAGAGWRLRLGDTIEVEVGHGEWRESSPLGRPVTASGGWQGEKFVADLYVITTPHRVRVEVDAEAGTAVARWNLVPLTGPRLELHLRHPLMTRVDVA